MDRPTIGITSPLESIDEEDLAKYEVGRHKRLLESVGARVVILPRGKATASALDRSQLDGLLFSGGGDVAPELYGGRPELADNRVDTVRDAGEMALLWRAFAERVPTLCVCRGMQLANIAFGGTLIEDLPSELAIRDQTPSGTRTQQATGDRDARGRGNAGVAAPADHLADFALDELTTPPGYSRARTATRSHWGHARRRDRSNRVEGTRLLLLRRAVAPRVFARRSQLDPDLFSARSSRTRFATAEEVGRCLPLSNT
jgi:hypothetical protein